MTTQNMHGDFVPGHMGPQNHPGEGQIVSVNTSSAQSAAIVADHVEISTDSTANVFLEFGTNPTATTTTSFRISPDVRYVLPFKSGDKVAVIGSAINGSVFIHPVN